MVGQVFLAVFCCLNKALHYLASKHDTAEVFNSVSLLLKHGASVHSNVDGRTPLWVYCASEHHHGSRSVELLTLLIEAGSNVNQQVKVGKWCFLMFLKDINGYSCLHGLCASPRDFSVTECLIKQ
jgi:ankyrin repeat protein